MQLDRKQQLTDRFIDVSHELAEMAKHKVMPGNLVSELEGELLEELDAIEYELGGGILGSYAQRVVFFLHGAKLGDGHEIHCGRDRDLGRFATLGNRSFCRFVGVRWKRQHRFW